HRFVFRTYPCTGALFLTTYMIPRYIMSRFYRLTVISSLLLLLVATPLYAQEKPQRRGLIENLLGPIVDLVREAATLDEDGPSGDRLREIVDEIRSTTLDEGDTVLNLDGLDEVP